MIEKLACLLLSSGLLGIAYVNRRVTGSWTSPACIYSLYWFAFTFLPALILFNVPASPFAMMYIIASCLAFSAGSFSVAWQSAWRVNATFKTSRVNVFDNSFIRYAFFGSLVVAMVSLVVNSFIQGFSLADLAGNLMESANSYIVRRYEGDLTSNIFSQIGLVMTYVTATLGGLVFFTTRNHKKRLVLTGCAMLPAIFIMLTQGAKGMLFVAIPLFVAAILVGKLSRGDRQLISGKALAQLPVYMMVLVPALTLSFVSRGLYNQTNITAFTDSLMRLYASYGLSDYYSFSDWFSDQIGQPASQYYSNDPMSLGFYTFMPIFRLMGDDRYVPPGNFDEYFQYGYFIQSNIYTHFRGLISDYGILGSLGVTVLASILSHQIYQNMIRSRVPGISAALYVMIFAYICHSFYISLFIWASTFAMLFILMAVFWVNANLIPHGRGVQGPPTVGLPPRGNSRQF